MYSAESEPVKLKAATEILDRAGVRAGFEITGDVGLDVRPAASIITERLQRLAHNTMEATARLEELTAETTGPVLDAEVVEITEEEVANEDS